MKLSKLILEFGEYKTQEEKFTKELESIAGDYRPYLYIGSYGGNRSDDDPLKDKGYGKISFRHRDSLPDQDYKKVIDWAESKGFEVVEKANWYDYEPGERDYWPTLKFHFDVGTI